MCEGRCIKEILLKKKNTFMNIYSYSFVSKRFGDLGASKDEMKLAVRKVKWFSHSSSAEKNLPGASSPIRKQLCTLRAGMVTEQSHAGLC